MNEPRFPLDYQRPSRDPPRRVRYVASPSPTQRSLTDHSALFIALGCAISLVVLAIVAAIAGIIGANVARQAGLGWGLFVFFGMVGATAIMIAADAARARLTSGWPGFHIGLWMGLGIAMLVLMVGGFIAMGLSLH